MDKPFSKILVNDSSALSASVSDEPAAPALPKVISPMTVVEMLKCHVLPLAESVTPMLRTIQDMAPQILAVQYGARSMVSMAHDRTSARSALVADLISEEAQVLPHIQVDDIDRGFVACTWPPDDSNKRISISFQQAPDGAMDIGISRMMYSMQYGPDVQERHHEGSLTDIKDFAFSLCVNPENGSIMHAAVVHSSIHEDGYRVAAVAARSMDHDSYVKFREALPHIESGIKNALTSFRIELRKARQPIQPPLWAPSP